MPTFQKENLVMWRGYAHIISLMDLLRLRTAGWVVESMERPDLHLGLVHATQEHDTPGEAARHLDMRAVLARQKRETERARRNGNVWVHAEPRALKGDADASGRVTTARARNASRRTRRRS